MKDSIVFCSLKNKHVIFLSLSIELLLKALLSKKFNREQLIKFGHELHNMKHTLIKEKILEENFIDSEGLDIAKELIIWLSRYPASKRRCFLESHVKTFSCWKLKKLKAIAEKLFQLLQEPSDLDYINRIMYHV